jgi:TIR domain
VAITTDTEVNMASNPSRLLVRLLDRGKNLDYFIAFVIGACPIAFSVLIGANLKINDYEGYLNQPNWWSLAIIFPAVLFAFRWVMAKIVPVGAVALPVNEPPIINILRDTVAKAWVYGQLRQRILAQINIRFTLLLVVIIHVLDMWPLFVTYATDVPSEFMDWKSVYLLREAHINKAINLLLLGFAYSAQFCVTFIGILSIILIFRHNYFFVWNVYQRHSMKSEYDLGKFHIDVNDIDRCFGFRIANEAFNTQIKALMLAGAAMFISRYAYAGQSGSIGFFKWSFSLPSFNFPLAGQWLMALSWLVALVIVSMPAFVKLLPRFQNRTSHLVGLTLESYLREFFSPETWPKDKFGKDEPVAVIASKFALNSFWPTGDNRASTLFFFSYWIFLLILLPPKTFGIATLLIIFTLYGIVAHFLRSATFMGLKWALSYVDELLVTEKPGTPSINIEIPEKSDVSIFISYRRSDSAPYARSIHKHLCGHLRDENIFMDIDDIEPGVKFSHEIEIALARVDAIIVLIGKDWAKVAGVDGYPRLQDPNDMVQFEIRTALALGKRIFPILVGGAKMPQTNELPDSLKELAQINALEVSDHRWDYDLGILVNALKVIG